MLKVNFDGAIFREEKKVGVRVIIRDQQGRVLASMANNFPLAFSVYAVEVFAAKEALKFALGLGLSTIILEGDSKHTIDSVMCEDVSLADIGHLIEEAKLYGRQFNVIEYRHVKREGNRAAHNIARHPRHVSEFSVWMEDVHPHLFAVIQADSAFIN